MPRISVHKYHQDAAYYMSCISKHCAHRQTCCMSVWSAATYCSSMPCVSSPCVESMSSEGVHLVNMLCDGTACIAPAWFALHLMTQCSVPVCAVPRFKVAACCVPACNAHKTTVQVMKQPWLACQALRHLLVLLALPVPMHHAGTYL